MRRKAGSSSRKPKASPRVTGTHGEHGDDWLWQHVTKDVIPLSPHRMHQTHTINPKTETKQSTKKRPNKINPRLFTEINHLKHQEPVLIYKHGAAPGLDKRTQLRLRRGQVKVEARIDLHGMIRIEAHEAIIRFIENAYYSNKRAVLVITGKGLRRDGSIGVLRSAVPQWLNELPMRDWVRAFDHAAPRDGGEGALYILLRRPK